MKARLALLLASVSTLALHGCGGGGGGGGGSGGGGGGTTPPPAPATVQLSAAATEVSAGGSTTLTWSSTNAASCTASGAWSGTRATSGSEQVGPIDTPATYTITCGGATQTVNVSPFSAQMEQTLAEPLEPLTITLSSVGAVPANGSPSFTVFIDVSGLGTFLPENTLEVPGMFGDGKIEFAAPLLEDLQPITPDSRFAVRVRRESDSLVSNVIEVGYSPIVIPSYLRGVPSVSLQLILKTLLENASTPGQNYAQKIRPGFFTDTRLALGITSDLPDIQAEAILRHAFGVSALAEPAQTLSVRAASARSVRLQGFGQSVLDGLERIIGCIRGVYNNPVNTWEAGAALECQEKSRIEMRDSVLPGFAEIPQEMASVTVVLSSSLRGRLARRIGSRVAEAELSAELAESTTALGQVVLTAPFEPPEATADYARRRLTEIGKRKLYDRLVKNLPEIVKYALEKLGAPELASEILSLTEDQKSRFYEIENSVHQLIDLTNQVAENPWQFGGADAPPPPAEVPLGGFASLPLPENVTPASVCAAYPELEGALASLGFASCEAYMTPFFDAEFVKNVIQPILDSIPFDQLEPCLTNFESPQCEALAEQLSAQLDQLFDALLAYSSGDLHCDGGYTEFESSVPGKRTCIFTDLTYTPVMPGVCFAGSRPVPFDIGNYVACMYYSRDYIQPGGTCRENYSKVFFLGTDRCRWATLPLNKPAAYSLDSRTGARATLEQ